MLSLYPIKIDGTAIPWPKKWEESPENVENENTTEGGKDVVDKVRVDKLSIKVTIGCTADWAKFFKQKSLLDSVTVKRFDIITEAYEERTMRIKKYKNELENGSHKVGVTNGIWEVSFELVEF